MEDSKIFVPRLSSLSHLATVKVAMNLYGEFHTETLDKAYKSIQTGIPLTSDDLTIYPGCNIAQNKLILMPLSLRKGVMDALHGLKGGVDQWKLEHASITGLGDGESIFYFRGDGTIDTVQTAQHLVWDPNIHIRRRFYLACLYCLEESIVALWAELEAAGETEHLEHSNYLVERFWVGWLRNGGRYDWKRATQGEFLNVTYPPVRYNSFFPALQPGQRHMFLFLLKSALCDDFLLCLKAMTKSEEDYILKRFPKKVLFSCLRWPLRSLFGEVAGKILKNISYDQYDRILKDLLSPEVNREDFDFPDFFKCFWECSPSDFRERAKNSSHLEEKIESCLNEERSKRKSDSFDINNQKIKKSRRDEMCVKN